MRQQPPDTASSRRCLLRLIGGAATLQIPTLALAGFDFFLSEYSATRAELQAEMAKRFPLQQRYAEVFTVSLRDPQLGLDPANNRLGVTTLLSIACARQVWKAWFRSAAPCVTTRRPAQCA